MIVRAYYVDIYIYMYPPISIYVYRYLFTYSVFIIYIYDIAVVYITENDISQDSKGLEYQNDYQYMDIYLQKIHYIIYLLY